jgi:hypothetical protein
VRLDKLAAGAWVGAVAVAAVTRTAFIGSKSLWFDEAATVRIVQQVIAWQVASRYSVLDACKASLKTAPTPEVLVTLMHDVLNSRAGEALSDTSRAALLQIENGGSPHDAVARFLRSVLHGQVPEVPGGVTEEVKEFLTVARAISLSEPYSVAMAYLVQAAVTGQRNGRGLGVYDKALFRMIGAQKEDSGFIDFLSKVADGGPLPSIPPELSEKMHAQLSTLRETLMKEEQSKTREDLGAMALRVRKGERSLIPVIVEAIEAGKKLGEPYDGIGKFMYALATGEDVPSVPENTPDKMQNYLYELRLLAFCGKDSFNIVPLLSSVLSFRHRGGVLGEEARELVDALEKAGGPYIGIHRFVQELMVRGSFPELPGGAPFKMLSIMAQARREAIEFEQVRIAVERDPKPFEGT